MRFTPMNRANSNPLIDLQIFSKRKLPNHEAKVDVVVIISRQITNPDWVNKCLDSIRGNSYGNIGIITINNNSLKHSIGDCWNAAIARSTAKYIMFVGDDDMISNTLIHDLVNGLHLARQANADVAAISCNMTMMDESAKTLGRMENPFTGLFIRDTLDYNPFDGSLKNNVDTELIGRYRSQGMHFAIIQHNFGYYYRRHKGMVSGEDRFTTPLPESSNG